jgi:hypothetical protein
MIQLQICIGQSAESGLQVKTGLRGICIVRSKRGGKIQIGEQRPHFFRI